VRQIFPPPPGAPEVGRDDIAALARLYAYPEPGEPSAGPWLRGNMIASTDGAAAMNGRTRGLSGTTDRLVFSLLRSLADVIVVGAGTARAERYRPVRPAETWPQLRAGRAPTPPLAVVSAGLDLGAGALVLQPAPGTAKTIVLTTETAPAAGVAAAAARADVIVAGEQLVSLPAAVTALAGRGYRRILVEGGPSLLGQFAADALLDELCLTYSPVLAGGSAGRILAGPPWAGRTSGSGAGRAGEAAVQVRPLARLELAHVLEDEGYLLCRYLRRPADP
jgi:riboflavin biosynthesis pyrimidine reductase